ncbi:MAG: carboxylesterase [Gammaproteobacteria bacterium]|nr:MAG: carboxylesterase [Gammaproteobacteria bacterium]
MTEKLLECIEIETSEMSDYAVIWLHGLGASAHDFEPIVPELNLLQRPGVRFVFPHAPVRPITVNGGMAMRGWYDIPGIDVAAREQDAEGIHKSSRAIEQLIEREIERGIPAERIILAGFSQGGAVVLYTGLVGKHRLGGIMALSTYVPLQDEITKSIDRKHPPTLPVFMGHGKYDEVVRLQYGEASRDLLESYGIEVEWHSYPIAHGVSAQEVHDMEAWFKRIFGM